MLRHDNETVDHGPRIMSLESFAMLIPWRRFHNVRMGHQCHLQHVVRLGEHFRQASGHARVVWVACLLVEYEGVAGSDAAWLRNAFPQG